VRKKRLSFEKFDRKGIPLAELLAVHRQFQTPLSLPGNLGDGFLFIHNPVFRNIREEYCRRGFSFTQENLHQYCSFPLMCLDEILDSRKIPYLDNVVWVEKLVSVRDFTLTELKRSELKFNYVFHESAHFIAHSVFFGEAHLKNVPKTKDSLLRILAGEAFANTVEAISASLAQGEIDSYFLDANCHFRSNEKEVATILRAAKKLGFEPVFRILFAAFLYSNYMHENLSKRELGRIARFAKVPERGVGILARIGLQLSEQFRGTTTHFHLIKIGFPVDLAPLLKGDPLEIAASSAIQQDIGTLVKLACNRLDQVIEFE